MYSIKSISTEGEYYLVNGWKKHRAVWTRTAHPSVNGFKTQGLAERSLRHLLKIFPEYRTDRFSFVTWDKYGYVFVTPRVLI